MVPKNPQTSGIRDITYLWNRRLNGRIQCKETQGQLHPVCNGATNCSLSAQKDCGPFPHGNKKKLSGGLHIETHSHPTFFPPCVPELWHQTSNALQETGRNFFEENLTSPKDTNTGCFPRKQASETTLQWKSSQPLSNEYNTFK